MRVLGFGVQGWMGPNYSISTACATSNHCILSAAQHIQRGDAVSPSLLLYTSVVRASMPAHGLARGVPLLPV